jgi:hypothetical protein
MHDDAKKGMDDILPSRNSYHSSKGHLKSNHHLLILDGHG